MNMREGKSQRTAATRLPPNIAAGLSMADLDEDGCTRNQ
jgi:hypothetical protein